MRMWRQRKILSPAQILKTWKNKKLSKKKKIIIDVKNKEKDTFLLSNMDFGGIRKHPVHEVLVISRK
jgi:hypothetical protein